MHLIGKHVKYLASLLAIILVIFLGIIDTLFEQDLYLSLFYLIPIALVTWYTTRRAGVLVTLLSAAAWLANDYLSGAVYSQLSVVIWNLGVRLNFFLIFTYMLSLLKVKLELESMLARIDPLTKVANRRYFYELAMMELNRASRYKKEFSVAYIDLDNFKLVNDRFGHQVGDSVLTVVASIIQLNLRKSDSISRLGGDEFIILFPETGNIAAQWVVFRIHNLLLKTVEERGWPVTLSIGVVTFNTPPASVDEILEKADTVMYSAKGEGKNRVKYEVVSEQLNVEP